MTTAYLDHAASTPMRPEALAAVVDVLERLPGNPSGQHGVAREARRALDDARDRIADVLCVDPGEVVFTSGGAEADHLAVAGSVAAAGGRPLCLATDHHAATDPVRRLGGSEVEVGPDGMVRLDRLGALLDGAPDTPVVSLALANNELGVVQPVAEVAEIVRRAAPKASLHLDAVAAASWVDLPPVVALADLVSISGHKVGGPKGIGVLVVRDGTPLQAQLEGSQERGRRGGTPNLAGAVGMAVALAQAAAERPVAAPRVAAQRDALVAAILRGLGDAVAETVPRSSGVERVANIAHLLFRHVHREALLFRLDELGVAASAGSSCSSGALEASHVVRAIGVPDHLAQGALRLSLGWCTTDDELERAAAAVVQAARDVAGTASPGAHR